ncbi:hypothetical protein HPB49_006291 [Dermacentor silvarum]|uniref:Uncharacterized protein n=1 Tax=Dermacentor silvarum TaxID=543639 RepID=A0ACB8CQB9_DERSI|nr:hypothetical protein HPB49_006291 [Dermacentor silvarum]
MAPTVPWTPSKAQVFVVVVATGNGSDAVVDATASIVGLSEVYLVQRMGSINFQVTLKSMASMTLIVTNVTYLFLPSFVPKEVLLQALSPYGKFLSLNADLMSGRPGVLTGTRFAWMEINPTTPVPNYLRVSGHHLTFDYRGLQRVYLRRGSSDHYHTQCTTVFCGHCDIYGHESEGCDRPCRCWGDGRPTIVCTVRPSYADAAAEAFPPLPPQPAAVATARGAVTKEIALTPHQPASANDKEGASSSGNRGTPCSLASSTIKEDRAIDDVTDSASTSAGTIDPPDRTEVLNTVKTSDHTISTRD